MAALPRVMINRVCAWKNLMKYLFCACHRALSEKGDLPSNNIPVLKAISKKKKKQTHTHERREKKTRFKTIETWHAAWRARHF